MIVGTVGPRERPHGEIGAPALKARHVLDCDPLSRSRIHHNERPWAVGIVCCAACEHDLTRGTSQEMPDCGGSEVSIEIAARGDHFSSDWICITRRCAPVLPASPSQMGLVPELVPMAAAAAGASGAANRRSAGKRMETAPRRKPQGSK